MPVDFRSVLAKLKSESKGEDPSTGDSYNDRHLTNTLSNDDRPEQNRMESSELAANQEAFSQTHDDDSIEIYLFKSREDESLGLQLNEFLVIVSVQNGSPAYHANVPTRHRVVTVNHQLVTALSDFSRVLSNLANPLEIHLRLVPLGHKSVFYPELVDKAVVRMLTESDLDVDTLSVNPRFDFLNETSPYHSVFRQRYEATAAALEFLDRTAVSFKADKFSKSVQSASYHTCTGEEYDSAIRWLENFIEPKKTGDNTNFLYGTSTPQNFLAMSEDPSNTMTDQRVVIAEAPMASISENAIGIEEALKLSEDAFTTEIPYDPFMFGSKENFDQSVQPMDAA
ncbi:hypothetical protein XU18_1710 [Perkinsela sp. CCAP 1560/4]|nr:hypothetical protein XU18_1710 [Perkinsela sp. CCAP 1560/4]|eukprot:KNH07616.1 hypothetical protein XU18_1710 [Perkinsela sp. CCAP 1560/4]